VTPGGVGSVRGRRRMQRSACLVRSLLDPRRHATFLGLTLRDALGIGRPHLGGTGRFGPREHLAAAMEWLCRAQDAVGTGGVSGGYSWLDGWQDPYPETTGYIIPTFLAYADLCGLGAYADRAVRMGDWELKVQMLSGALPGGIGLNDYPIVFNTGQVILGWTALYRRTGRQAFLDAAVAAAGWLASIQDADGKWSRHTFNQVPHAYHSRVAWPILEVWALTGRPELYQTAERNVQWVLSRAEPSGWFRDMGFRAGELPFTHTIAYTLDGLIECALRLREPAPQAVWAAVERACERILMGYERRKRDPRGWPAMLPGILDDQWRGRAGYSCLTGNVQTALVFIRLFEHGGDARYLNAALKLIDQTRAAQPMRTSNPDIRGAVPGSFPIWGGYARLGFPNWSAKFLADALMAAETAVARLEGAAS